MSDTRTLPSRVSVLRSTAAVPMELPTLVERREQATTALVPNVVEASRAAGYDAGMTAGHAEGFALGYEEGIAAAAVELEALRGEVTAEREQARIALANATRAIDHAAGQIGPAGTNVYEAIQTRLAHAAVALAEAILGRELRDPTHRGADAIERVMALAPDRVPVTVRLSPNDAELVWSTDDAFQARGITIVEDASLTPGDAIAELEDSEIDGRIAAAIERVHTAMGLGTDA